jgi:hypothetical protein
MRLFDLQRSIKLHKLMKPEILTIWNTVNCIRDSEFVKFNGRGVVDDYRTFCFESSLGVFKRLL